MARVDAVIGYGLYGIGEELALAGANTDFEPDDQMHAQVAAKVKMVAGIAMLGASDIGWPEASICTATSLGFPAEPDPFEISAEVDGSQIFGKIYHDEWTFMPGKGDLPGLFVPTNNLQVDDTEGSFVQKPAFEWELLGVIPEMVLALSGLGIKLRLDDPITGISSLGRVQEHLSEGTTTPLTAGIMLKFASNKHSGMWLGEADSKTALKQFSELLERFDPSITSSVDNAISALPE